MYLHIVLLDGHVYSSVHCSQNVKAFFTSAYGSDVHEHDHTHNIYVGKEKGVGVRVDLNVDVDVEVSSSLLSLFYSDY